MEKRRNLIVLLISLVLLTACSVEPIEPTPDIAGTAAVMAETIVAVQLTKAAEEATSTPNPTETPTPEPTNTPTANVLPTLYPTAVGGEGECLLAHMVRETIADGSVMAPGEQFDKIWVLQNSGTCSWTSGFSAVFHHGNNLGAPVRMDFPGSVAPGESFSLTIPMVAPAVEGSYLSFWNLESDGGEAFGTTSSGLFWAQILVEEETPPSSFYDIWSPSSKGALLFTGEINSDIVVGDTKHNYQSQGFVTFDLWNLPTDATVSAVKLIYEGSAIDGSPFSNLGCMGVYGDDYGSLEASDFFNDTPGGALWSFCSAGEISSGVSRIGGEAAIAAIQNSLGSKIQFRFQFNGDTDNNGVDDTAKLFPLLRIEYTTP